MKILVTGGQGFLGGALTRQLLLNGYQEVAATCRRPAPELEALGVEVLQVDLTNAAQASACCQGRQVIFHTAAKAGVWGHYQDYYGANVLATKNLLDGAREHGVSHFVHTSTPSVTFQGVSSFDEEESAGYGSYPWNHYCQTKIESEKYVLQHSGDLKTMALRPHLIYGPGDPHLLPRVFAAARANRLARVGSGANWVDVTHIQDAVNAHLSALNVLDQERAWGQSYFITSGKPVRLWSWLAHLLSWAEQPPIRKQVSLKTAVQIGSTLETVFKRLDWSTEPPMTKFSALQLGCSHTYSIRKAKEILGYQPVVDPFSSFEGQGLEKNM